MYPLVNPVDYQRTQQILTAIETQDILTLIDLHLSITNQRAKDLTTLFPSITALRWVLDLNLISEFDIQSIDDHVAKQWRLIFTICHYNVFGDTYHIEIKIMTPVVIITVWNQSLNHDDKISYQLPRSVATNSIVIGRGLLVTLKQARELKE